MNCVIGKSFKQEAIGKYISSSKSRLTWVIEINGIENTIVLTLSYMSRKYEIFVNGISQKKGSEVMGNFTHEFTLNDCFIQLISSFDSSVLKVNGTLFTNLPKSSQSFMKMNTEQGHQVINNRQTQPQST